MRETIVHNIEEPSDWEVDWSTLLAADEVIAKSSWFLDHDGQGKLKLKSSNTEKTATVDIRGGIPNNQHDLRNQIWTSKDRHFTASYWLTIDRRDKPEITEVTAPKINKRKAVDAKA